MTRLWGTRRKTWLAALSLAAAAPVALPDTVELSNGDTLTGTVTAQDASGVTLQHAVLGEITVPTDRVAGVTLDNPAQADTQVPAPQPEAAEESGAETQAAAEPAGEAPAESMNAIERFFDEWDSRLTLGLNGASGNTDKQNFRVMFNARRTDGRDRWDYNARWLYAFANGNQVQNQIDTSLSREWLQEDSPWFFFVRGQYVYDQRRSFENRTSGFGGGGYTITTSEDLEVNTRLGFGGTYEYGSVNEFTPEALFGGSVVTWNINERASLEGETLFYPALTDGNNYRIESTLEWIYRMDMADGVSFKIGLENEYDSDVTGSTVNNDLTYYAAIVFDF